MNHVWILFEKNFENKWSYIKLCMKWIWLEVGFLWSSKYYFVNRLLIKHYDEFVSGVAAGGKILVPLCGKTVDMKWYCTSYSIIMRYRKMNQKTFKVEWKKFHSSWYRIWRDADWRLFQNVQFKLPEGTTVGWCRSF